MWRDVVQPYFAEINRVLGRRWLIALGLLLAGSLFEGVGILMLIPLLHFIGVVPDQGRLNENLNLVLESLHIPKTLPSVLLFFFGLLVARETLSRFSQLYLHRLKDHFIVTLRLRLFRNITRAQWLFLAGTRSARFAQTLTSDMARIGSGTNMLIQWATACVFFAVYFGLALYLSAVLTTAVALISIVMGFVLRKHLNRSGDLGKRQTFFSNRLFEVIGEHLAGTRLVKSFGREDRGIAHFEQVINQIRQNSLNFMRLRQSSMVTFSLGSSALFCIFIYVAVAIIQISAVRLLLLLFIFSRIMPRLSVLIQNTQNILHTLSAYNNFLSLERDCLAHAEPFSDVQQPLPLNQSLRLRNIHFVYPGRQSPALEGIDIAIPANQTTAIVGPSGAGKSTLADVISGLIAPQEGALILDGKQLDASSLHCWRRSIGSVPQGTFLFHDSVAANLRWVAEDATEEQLWHALESACAADFVRSLPDGLETLVGERGVKLSGGEAQRLALARALLMRPQLLLLDEATSSLDVHSERHIQQAIDNLRGHTTIVIIAHRLSTIRDADQILFMDHGRVVEQGSWSELSENPNSRFKHLIETAQVS